LKIPRQLALLALAAAALLLVGAGRSGTDPAEPLTPRRARLLGATCATCHLRPESGAPQAGDPGAWDLTRGIEPMLVNTVNGRGRMPPLGMCGACDEEDLRALIRFLSGLPASGTRP